MVKYLFSIIYGVSVFSLDSNHDMCIELVLYFGITGILSIDKISIG